MEQNHAWLCLGRHAGKSFVAYPCRVCPLSTSYQVYNVFLTQNSRRVALFTISTRELLPILGGGVVNWAWHTISQCSAANNINSVPTYPFRHFPSSVFLTLPFLLPICSKCLPVLESVLDYTSVRKRKKDCAWWVCWESKNVCLV